MAKPARRRATALIIRVCCFGCQGFSFADSSFHSTGLHSIAKKTHNNGVRQAESVGEIGRAQMYCWSELCGI